ncbi:hypothetical protein [Plantactinospora soyae]|uniref:Uncharacterized protein n=1 Tax=Plantactinospora soyae TaxID=1544732 RepID=A0A927MF18_9ACTN|nr:hypothetical protein [Plantactinospora soyae]MBE1492470.1 hypothetical protein [Plantactinospora soyae]
MNHYFALVDDEHDVNDPFTVVRVSERTGVFALDNDAAWVRTRLLDRIEAGEVAYQVRSISERAAARIQQRREEKVSYRYSILVFDDDPTAQPTGVLREWDASNGSGTYGQVYTRDCEWENSNIREDIERQGSDVIRIVPSDAATVSLFIDAIRRRFG